MTMKFKNYGGAPSSPPAGYVGLYSVSDTLYWITSAGVTTSIASGTGDLKADGTVPLSSDWDLGSFRITAEQLESDVPTGTAPLIIASTTLVSNLNAELLQGAGLLDEDNLGSDSDTDVPTQQSVKSYVDQKVTGAIIHKGGYDASTNTPDLDTSPAGVKNGDSYKVSVAGNFFTEPVVAGDTLVADQDDPTLLSHWTVIGDQRTPAEVKTAYESNSDTNAFTDSEKSDLAGAILDSDISEAEGMLRKTGAGTYEGIKTNLSSAVDPSVDDDTTAGYEIYSPWLNTVTNTLFFCMDATDGAAVWQAVGSGGGGLTPEFHTASFTAEAGKHYYIDSSGGAVAVTLPAGADLDHIEFDDWAVSAGTSNITITPDGAETIDEGEASFIIDQDNGGCGIVYDDSATDWRTTKRGMPELSIAGRQTDMLYPEEGLQRDSASAPAISYQSLGGGVNVLCYDLPDAAYTNFNLKLKMPQRWNGGTLRVRFWWMPSNTNTGNCSFSINTCHAADGEAFSTKAFRAGASDPGSGTALKAQATPWTAAFSPSDADHNDFQLWQMFRDGVTDAFNGVAYLMAVELEWTSDAVNDNE